MRFVVLIIGALGITACVQPKTSSYTNTAIRGSIHSHADKLKVGMSETQVKSVIGPKQFSTKELGKVVVACDSHIYDETLDAKFVHVRYVNGRLISAADGYNKTC